MVETAQRRGFRWARGLGRATLLLVGGTQCLLGVMFGVGLLFSAFIYVEDGPEQAASSILLLVVDVVLFGVGLLALLSGLESWEPPDNRWRGVRWPVLGLASGAITLVSWVVVAAAIWGR